jgi:Type I restriction modification DNA specificity domain
MWTSASSISELEARGRWKVEFFCNERATSVSGFPMLPVRALVEERSEALDPQRFPEHLFAYIGLENVETLTGDLVAFEPKPGSAILSRSKVFRENDILYGRLRPNLNKVFLVEPPAREGVCSGEFYVLIPDIDKVRPRFLRAILASCYVQTFVCNWQTGSALPRLQLDDLLNLEIPVPPLAVQDQFIEMLKRTDTERQRAKQVAKHLTSQPMAVFEAALADGHLPMFAEEAEAAECPALGLPDGPFGTRRRARNAIATLL